MSAPGIRILWTVSWSLMAGQPLTPNPPFLNVTPLSEIPVTWICLGLPGLFEVIQSVSNKYLAILPTRGLFGDGENVTRTQLQAEGIYRACLESPGWGVLVESKQILVWELTHLVLVKGFLFYISPTKMMIFWQWKRSSLKATPDSVIALLFLPLKHFHQISLNKKNLDDWPFF